MDHRYINRSWIDGQVGGLDKTIYIITSILSLHSITK